MTNSKNNRCKFEGIIPPMVTPLQDERTLDVQGLENLVEHLIAGGVHGLFILGTTGEGPSLSYKLRIELIKRVCELVEDRIPILVGITDSSFIESLNIAEKAVKYDASAVVAAPPYYLNISDDELFSYINQLTEALPLPLMLYNYPGLTKHSYPVEMVNKLIDKPGIVGVKDSSADLAYFQKINNLKKRKNFSLLIGPEELLAESLIMGGGGGVSGGANLFPELYVRIYEAVRKKNYEEAIGLHEKVMQLSNIVYSGDANSSGNVISGIKNALYQRGICSSDYIAHPLKKVAEKKAKRIKNFIDEFKF